MKPLTHCPGCNSERLSTPWLLPREPVINNYRCPTPAAAAKVPRRDLRLAQCRECGLIFNSALDTKAVPYDDRYENRQCFSAAFTSHLQTLADDLTRRHKLRGGRILEVGCGKGDFLRMFCESAGARGIGYDSSYAGPPTQLRGRIKFHRRYVGARDIRSPFDVILCRHVVEHVGAIGDFLAELHAIAIAAGGPPTVIETPTFEWIHRNGTFWDIFYEHCNYFTRPCLEHLCRRVGFKVQRRWLAFGGQYQFIELGVATRPPALRPPGATVRLGDFARLADGRLRQLETRLIQHHATRHGWAIWGAAAKGVALANRLRVRPDYMIDANVAKQGCFVPGAGVPIIAPDDPRIGELGLVLIANPNYKKEITFTLRQSGFKPTLLTV
jgi:SAM-dependent methyltransferase